MELAIRQAKVHNQIMKVTKTLRGKLFLWYATSLITISAFFYLGIHIFRLSFGNFIFFFILLLLAIEGLFIIRKMTNQLSLLSEKIKTITSKNLNEKIINIGSEDEIGELSNSFNQLLDRLDEAFTRERQFIGDVAHELKTPLSGQRASLELALTRNRSKREYKKVLEEALIDSNKISDTLKNILDLAWSQAEGAQKGKTVVNLSRVINEIREIATKLAYDKQISVEGSTASHIQVEGRSDKLSRAFLNIIDNAIKFTPDKGTVTIDLIKKNGAAIFKVKDTGIGIPKSELKHVFNRFYRGTKSDKTFGSGLGLAIAQAVIKAHKGSIEVISKVGKGTTFSITLPLIKP